MTRRHSKQHRTHRGPTGAVPMGGPTHDGELSGPLDRLIEQALDADARGDRARAEALWAQVDAQVHAGDGISSEELRGALGQLSEDLVRVRTPDVAGRVLDRLAGDMQQDADDAQRSASLGSEGGHSAAPGLNIGSSHRLSARGSRTGHRHGWSRMASRGGALPVLLAFGLGAAVVSGLFFMREVLSEPARSGHSMALDAGTGKAAGLDVRPGEGVHTELTLEDVRPEPIDGELPSVYAPRLTLGDTSRYGVGRAGWASPFVAPESSRLFVADDGLARFRWSPSAQLRPTWGAGPAIPVLLSDRVHVGAPWLWEGGPQWDGSEFPHWHLDAAGMPRWHMHDVPGEGSTPK